MFIVTANFLKKYPVFFNFEKKEEGLRCNPVSELEEASLFTSKNEALKNVDMLRTKLGIESDMSYSDIDILKVKVVIDDESETKNSV